MEKQSSSGGSKSTDFQPTTGNPQSNVNGSLQPNATNLQPITTPNESNSFNQPGINPQAFPKTESLQVLDTGPKVKSSTFSATKNEATNSGFLFVFIISVVVVLAVILLIAKLAKPAPGINNPELEKTDPIAEIPKSSKKKKSKKKKSKNRSKK